MANLDINTAIKATPDPTGRRSQPQKVITEGIVSAIIERYNARKGDTAGLAPSLKKGSLQATLAHVFYFVKRNIRYQLDPAEGEVRWQFIKRPSVILRDGYGDCKSYAILIGSILYHLQIPFAFRFVSYDQDREIRHVYIAAFSGGKVYPLDPCLDRPFTEKKPITNLQDMETKVVHIDGIGSIPRTTTEAMQQKPLSQLSEGEFMLLQERERLVLEMDLIRKSGHRIPATYRNQVDAIEDALQSLNPQELALIDQAHKKGVYHLPEGTSNAKRRMYNQKRKASRIQEMQGVPSFPHTVEIFGVGGFFSNAAALIKKAVSSAGNSVKETVLRTILSVTLPKAAPMFAYLFVSPSELTPVANRKRNKAAAVKAILIQKLKISEDTFMRTVRNGIMKQTKQTPEGFVNSLKAQGGIGAVPVWLIPAINAVASIVSSLFSAKAEKEKASMGKDDAPDPSDFAGQESGSGSREPGSPQDQPNQAEPKKQGAGVLPLALAAFAFLS